MAAGFTLEVRVYYEDTDAGGVVFYANYLKFMERARTEWLRELGFEQDRVMEADGVVFAVTRANLDFRKPARFNDLLEVTASIKRLGKASFNLFQEIFRDGELLVRGDVKLACVDKQDFSPARIPERIYEKVKSVL
jgi:acyl-CoA thioester hydrolase